VIFHNTKRRAERSERMLERSDDYPKGEITKHRKTGGVDNKNNQETVFLTLFKGGFSQWYILFLSKLGYYVKTLSQITPFWSFLSPDEWHAHCITNNNRKGKLCHCKPSHQLSKEKLFPSRQTRQLEWSQ